MAMKVDPKKVEDLKEKVKKITKPISQESGKNINSTLYGSETENTQASGSGEF